ncbi:MAG: bifunctional oligoribonuclease/PAP phosphatase NrnA [Firmicutes bacterium]|nr:bifunctional oligoribonuclease/PAP phosphatase NrnA [Bacillota bacterium]
MDNLTRIVKELANAPSVLICSHVMPDGDSIGSMLALGLAMEKINKKVVMAANAPIPDVYRFLAGSQKVRLPVEVVDIPPVAVILDCTEEERVGDKLLDLIRPIPVKINIDHHISNTGFGEYRWVDPAAAATGELIFTLLKTMDVPLDPPIATAIYTALVMDTGSFQYSNTTDQTHRIAAELLLQGADLDGVREYLFETQPVVVLRLLAEVLSSLQLSEDGWVAWMVVTRENVESLGVSSEHFEGIVNYPKSVAGVEVGLLFRELEPGKIKVSLRSKRLVDVNKLAARFGGGGHQRAAGCIVIGSLAEVVQQVVAAAREAVAKVKTKELR